MTVIMEFTWCLLGLLVVVVASSQVSASAEFKTFRSLFTRVADQRLSAIVARQISNSSIEHCSEACVKETLFHCKSYDFDNRQRACLLFSVSVDDADVYLISSAGRDHYKTAYIKLFHRLPNHMLTRSHNMRVDHVSSEECARRCVLEMNFKCQGFDYETATRTCWMTELTPEQAGGVHHTTGWEYYQRQPDGPLEHFVNYGFGHMRPLRGSEVYERVVMGVTLENCATLCLAEQTFYCVSFDYHFSDEDNRNYCYLSKYIAANVYGLEAGYDSRTMHFEKKQHHLSYFYATPYAVVLGNNHKTYTRITPDRCARMCLEEEAFVCRSFDYKVEHGTCQLSSKTGSDVGGLYNQGLREVHHFEMIPLADCGGNLTHDEGNFASPNWPRNYAHHEYCKWNIQVTKHKVINFRFTHLDLGLMSHDPCRSNEDRVEITEYRDNIKEETSFCVLPNTKRFTTMSNKAAVTFSSNEESDGQGFRVFYKAVWPCDVHLSSAPGEFASEGWPEKYPPSTRCSWRITAPHGMRVRVSFDSFELEQHALGHCNENHDHVIIQDGGTVSAPRIGLYCGDMQNFEVSSSGRDLFIQFRTDQTGEKKGFHAFFNFVSLNGTVVTLPGGDKTVEKVIPIDEDGNDVLQIPGEPSVGRRQFSADSPAHGHADHHYKTTMWAIISTLLLLLVILGIILYLVWQRQRGRQNETIREERIAEIVPLQNCAASSANRRNNELDLGAAAAAAASKDSAFANHLYDEPLKPNHLYDEVSKPYNVYDEPEKPCNLKNLNVDANPSKC